ncbi:aminoglycoside phosphotransferase family protein [Rathayibacter sp. VKM Ac-2801]|uniref:aminoglycoside phosphotransferase family protein n=1 Tax=Rathayibacter sp. VKM Ac-2801 TaxID=2609255 RepID=UPI00131FEBD8|nr:aminoglycoside phosphotransferase family protein [Rathayibacter sp. VKM Ac-2801]QHC69204.1 phosphotransferase [Rathayibacter sp. VKM Ac-2801]
MDTIEEAGAWARTLVRREFGVGLVDLEPVVGGLDHGARVWCASDADGALWSVKASRRDGRFGLALSAGLGEAGVRGIASPRRASDGLPWTEDAGQRVSLAPWILGEDAVETGEDALDWHGFGAVLRSVHDAEPPAVAPPVRRGIRRLRRRPADLLAETDERLTADDAHPRLTAVWNEHRSRLDALALAERRLKRTRTPTSRVPLHGDPHPGNVVIDEAGRPWLIDFDEATVAPREVDLLLIELGVIYSRPITDGQRSAFRSGYGEALIDDERIIRFGCVRAVEDVAATVALALADPGPEEREAAPVPASRLGRAASALPVPTPLDLLAGQLGPHGLVSLVETALRRPA